MWIGRRQETTHPLQDCHSSYPMQQKSKGKKRHRNSEQYFASKHKEKIERHGYSFLWDI
jgi:hypothetical protein